MTLQERWSVTQGAFDRLLESLDTDRDRAGEKYELLRTRLIKFFEWRGGLAPEDQADEVINRVMRRLHQGAGINHFEGFVYGAARMVLLESLRGERERRELNGAVWVLHAGEGLRESEARQQCLETCLQRLRQEDRELIIEYYRGQSGERILVRKALAGRLGVPLGAVRIRVHRIRARLEECLHECLGNVHAVRRKALGKGDALTSLR